MKDFDWMNYIIDKGQPLLDALLVFVFGWYCTQLAVYLFTRISVE